jgi:transcriptional regulator with XRE-family HTH domain
MTLVWASYLSEIETGKKAGSIAVLKRLAAALGVTVDDVIVER